MTNTEKSFYGIGAPVAMHAVNNVGSGGEVVLDANIVLFGFGIFCLVLAVLIKTIN